MVPYLKKHGTDPVTGKKMELKDLLKLNFHKREGEEEEGEEGKYVCPITLKPFNRHSHIVAIKTSGHVYSFEAVKKFNLQTNNMNCLLSSTPFLKSDIITLQAPFSSQLSSSPSPPKLSFYQQHKQENQQEKQAQGEEDIEGEGEEDIEGGEDIEGEGGEDIERKVKEEINLDATALKVFQTLKKRKESEKLSGGKEKEEQQQQTKKKKKEASSNSSSHSSTTSGIMKKVGQIPQAPSFTSSSFTAKKFDSNFIQPKLCKQKAYVRIYTNFGVLNFLIHSDLSPLTSENFLTHCANGYYNGTKFHRLVPGFMIQGGDPLSRLHPSKKKGGEKEEKKEEKRVGEGGESIFGRAFQDEFHPSLSHNKRGILSMANSGPNTNNSQFFITFKPKTHLDSKHTVFGELVGGMETLDKLEEIPTNTQLEAPLLDIIITDCHVHEDPFAASQKLVQQENQKKKEEAKMEEEKKQKGQWFSNPHKNSSSNDKVGIGKYIKPSPSLSSPSLSSPSSPSSYPHYNKIKLTFGDSKGKPPTTSTKGSFKKRFDNF